MDDLTGRRATNWGPSTPAGRSSDSPSRTLGDAAAARIYEDIVAGRLAPGRKLKPEVLKELYGVGTSPIREALLRLSAEGLVVMDGQRGFRVPATSEAELLDIADIRVTLSVLALRRSVARGDENWEAGIVAAFHKLDRLAPHLQEQPAVHREAWEMLNRDFHLSLEAACGSPWLRHFANVAFSQSERYRRQFVEYPVLLPDAQDEHRAIMEAALGRNVEAACAHLAHHIVKGMEIVRRGMMHAKE